jgi:methanogenic corrinoid protein MtbC1
MSGLHQHSGSRPVSSGMTRASSAARSTLRRLANHAPTPPQPEAPLSAELVGFVDLLVHADETAASSWIDERIVAGTSADIIVLEALAPAAREVGRRWEEDECDFVAVTLALGRLQRILRSLAARLAASGRAEGPVPGTVCVACLPDEQHTFGASICAEFFARDGWQVMMGGPLSRTDTVELVRHTPTDVVALSVSRSTSFPAVARLISRLRRASTNKRLMVLIGGPMSAQVNALPDRLGADAATHDVADAVRLARASLRERQAFRGVTDVN